MGQVTTNSKNQLAFAPTVTRSVNPQIAMPKEIMSAHGIVRTTSAANRFPKALLADEEFKKFRTQASRMIGPRKNNLTHDNCPEKQHANEFRFEPIQFHVVSTQSTPGSIWWSAMGMLAIPLPQGDYGPVTGS